MSLPVGVLQTPLTAAQVEATILTTLTKVGVAVTNWKTSGSLRVTIAAIATVIASVTSIIAMIASAAYLDYATGVYLTWLAYYVYGVTRIDATFASGTVTLTNGGGGSFSFAAGDVTVQNPITGATYTITQAFSLTPVGTTGATVANLSIQATASGSASTSAAGAISAIVTSILGVTCTNPAAVVGVDAESDPDLVTRCRDKLGSLSPNGPAGAYSFVAKGTTDANGINQGITRVQVSPSSHVGQVTAYLATSSGAANSTAVSLVNAAFLTLAQPLGITASGVAATEVPVSISYIALSDGTSMLSTAQLQANVATALGNLFATWPVGGKIDGIGNTWLFLDSIRAAIRSADPSIFSVQLTSPTGDVALAIGQVATLTIVYASIPTVLQAAS
jgi:hypothetical protein